MTMKTGADRQFVLDCWRVPEPGETEPDECWCSDDEDELVIEANGRIERREFQMIELCEKRPELRPDGWYRITRFTVPEQP